jgi:hypothetical protein
LGEPIFSFSFGSNRSSTFSTTFGGSGILTSDPVFFSLAGVESDDEGG